MKYDLDGLHVVQSRVPTHATFFNWDVEVGVTSEVGILSKLF